MAALLAILSLALWCQPAAAREAVWASEPQDISVTIYRDPYRYEGQEMNRNYPRGFALISETRSVTLPPGESTIRFDGVSEGMVAVSAIVTGLPGGTIEKNRNADLLSPAALVDGTLGNRVTITRMNPATGAEQAEPAIVRTRADGGIVLETSQGFEAVRCSGLPEKLTFDRVPDGLSARPVYSVDTRSPEGGTYEVVLTYLSWGFDWQAHYVASFEGQDRRGNEQLRMRSWLSLLNDNGQSFENAKLQAVAGELSIVSDFQSLAAPPRARGLRLECYPIGSTAAGSPYASPPPAPPAPQNMRFKDEERIIVTGALMADAARMEAPVANLASEEQLGDLKLYRISERVTVASKSLKQIAFLDKDKVEGRLFYRSQCEVWNDDLEPLGMQIVLETENDEDHGLGAALPMGGVTMFEQSADGELLVGEDWLRDHAEGQDVELEIAQSSQVFSTCTTDSEVSPYDPGYPWVPLSAVITNANPEPVTIKLKLGPSGEWRIRERLRGLSVEDGQWTLERTIAANRAEKFAWNIRYFAAESEE
ncbi:MAG TPA: hypothetical protein VLA37_04665 [Sphingomonadaceae bacterium]|nr:hypothetical protein [Sphingomonadaceae bacterium]